MIIGRTGSGRRAPPIGLPGQLPGAQLAGGRAYASGPADLAAQRNYAKRARGRAHLRPGFGRRGRALAPRIGSRAPDLGVGGGALTPIRPIVFGRKNNLAPAHSSILAARFSANSIQWPRVGAGRLLGGARDAPAR